MTATGRAQGQAVPHAAEEGDLVVLELHPGTAAVAEPPPGQVVRHHLRGDRHAGGKTLQRRHQCGSVRLPRGQPTQPAQRCSSCSRLELRRRDRVRGPGPPPRSSHVRGRDPAPVQHRTPALSPRAVGRRRGRRVRRQRHRAGPSCGSPRSAVQRAGERRLARPPAWPRAGRGRGPSSARPGAPPGGPGGRGRRRRAAAVPTRRRRARSARGRTARRRACRAARVRRRPGRRWRRPGWWRSTSGASQRLRPRRAQSAVRTSTPSRSPQPRISSARAALRTYAVTGPVQIRGERGERGGGGGAGAEDGGRLDLVDAALAQRGDHAGDVGVVADAAAVLGEDDGVDGLHGGRGVADAVEQRDDRALERHGQRQPGPASRRARSRKPGSAASSTSKRSYDQSVEAEFRVRGAVQHRGEGVGDRRAEDRRPPRRRAHWPFFSCCCFVLLDGCARAPRW